MKGISVILVALSLALIAATSLPAPTQSEKATPGTIVSRETGYPVHFPDGRLMRVKVGPQSTGSRELVMVCEDMPPGTAVPVHRHNRDEEILFVQRGVVTVTLGDQDAVVEAGSTVYVPRGTWIGVRNTGTEPATVVAVFAHPDMETCFRLLDKVENGTISPQERAEYTRACAWTVK